MKVAGYLFTLGLAVVCFLSLGADGGGGCVVVPPPQQPQQPPPQAQTQQSPPPRQPAPPQPAPPPSAPALNMPTTIALGCRCGPNTTIVVQCSVSNRNKQPMTVTLRVLAESGSLGYNARGASQPIVLPTFATANYEVVADFDALMDCSSCKNSQCAVQ